MTHPCATIYATRISASGTRGRRSTQLQATATLAQPIAAFCGALGHRNQLVHARIDVCHGTDAGSKRTCAILAEDAGPLPCRVGRLPSSVTVLRLCLTVLLGRGDAMSAYMAVAQPVTPAWLTAVLRQEGILPHGEVSAVERNATDAFNSRTDHLVLHYSADAPPGVPTQLILKQNIQETWGREAGAQEVAFYTLVASLARIRRVSSPVTPPRMTPRVDNPICFFRISLRRIRLPSRAINRSALSRGFLLPRLSTPSSRPWHRRMPIGGITLFGRRTGSTWGTGPGMRNALRQYLQRRRNAWDGLMARERAWFPDDVRDLYEHVLGHLHRHWEQFLEPRFRARRNLTLVHGDAYFANFLCPKNARTWCDVPAGLAIGEL